MNKICLDQCFAVLNKNYFKKDVHIELMEKKCSLEITICDSQ